MNIKKAFAPVANNAIGIYSVVAFIPSVIVGSVRSAVEDANQAINNKIFG